MTSTHTPVNPGALLFYPPSRVLKEFCNLPNFLTLQCSVENLIESINSGSRKVAWFKQLIYRCCLDQKPPSSSFSPLGLVSLVTSLKKVHYGKKSIEYFLTASTWDLFCWCCCSCSCSWIKCKNLMDKNCQEPKKIDMNRQELLWKCT